MANTDFKTVDEYLATRPDEIQPLLKLVRKAIKKALPQADEVISYQIPAYKIGGKNVIFFAGWKEHYAVYPANEALVAALMADLELNRGKVLLPGKLVSRTIQFPLDAPVPVDLIARIARLRAADVATLSAAKGSAAKPKGRAGRNVKATPQRPTRSVQSKRGANRPR